MAAKDEFAARRVWLGPDDWGVELEIVALLLRAELLVIHVMPTALRRKPCASTESCPMVTPELRARAAAEADRQGRRVSNVAREALERYLAL